MQSNVWTRAAGCESGACIEVKTTFRKATFSSDTSNCVEIATCDCSVEVRDSKNPEGPVLTFTHAEWTAFTAGVRNNEFEL